MVYLRRLSIIMEKTNMKNYLRKTKQFPCHYSIGAVVLNDKNQVMCHYFDEISGLKQLYILMRESPEKNESIEQTLKRGLMEEFGAKTDIVQYIGSLVGFYNEDKLKNIEKTTLYFLCKLKEFDLAKRDKNDPEFGSKVLFLTIDDLITKIDSQTKRYKDRSDLDERKILEKVKIIYKD